MSIFVGVISINLRLFFSDVFITNPLYVLLGESYHGQISIGVEYKLFAYWLLSKLQTLM